MDEKKKLRDGTEAYLWWLERVKVPDRIVSIRNPIWNGEKNRLRKSNVFPIFSSLLQTLLATINKVKKNVSTSKANCRAHQHQFESRLFRSLFNYVNVIPTTENEDIILSGFGSSIMAEVPFSNSTSMSSSSLAYFFLLCKTLNSRLCFTRLPLGIYAVWIAYNQTAECVRY